MIKLWLMLTFAYLSSDIDMCKFYCGEIPLWAASSMHVSLWNAARLFTFHSSISSTPVSTFWSWSAASVVCVWTEVLLSHVLFVDTTLCCFCFQGEHDRMSWKSRWVPVRPSVVQKRLVCTFHLSGLKHNQISFWKIIFFRINPTAQHLHCQNTNVSNSVDWNYS